MRTIIILVILLTSFSTDAQKEFDQDWSAFFQKFDAVNYRNGKFRLKAFVRVENGDKTSHAALWARVDNVKGIGFFDNMANRPIATDQWNEYTIEGDIGPKAEFLVVGGLYYGFGKYFYDHFTLEVKKENSDWESMPLLNGNFENKEIYEGWKKYSVKGYESTLATANAYEGLQSLVIDGEKRSALSFGNNKDGKYVDANNIKIYYEEYGAGEPVLLLHGNGQSINDFKNQIPELSKKFKVIAMDSRGQGKSTEDGKKLTYELMAEDVNAFLDKLNPGAVNILGWSDGGNTGLILAMKHPEKVKSLATMGANLFNDKTSVDQKINKEFRQVGEILKKKNEPGLEFKLQLIDLVLNEPRINPDDLKIITCPTLVMAGSKDVIKEGHTKLIASKISKSKLIIFKNGTHMEPEENPERFNATVVGFFTGEGK